MLKMRIFWKNYKNRRSIYYSHLLLQTLSSSFLALNAFIYYQKRT